MANKFDPGTLDIIAGTVDASAATVSSDDGAITLTDNGTGDFTITFNHDFLSAPHVVANVITTFATTSGNYVEIQSITTSAVQFNVVTNVTAGTVTALADLDFCFLIFGKRNR